jgi:hypothetical protein
MNRGEYLLSLLAALLVLASVIVWTHATDTPLDTALSCRSGRVASPVTLKGMSLYPRCPAGKRG